nr:MAG TPA: hypothetical protein [Caudoviricetes sp.]
MERLTEYESIAGHAHAIPIVSDMDVIMMRLAAYEDTGLEPAMCANYKTFEDEAISKGVTFKRIIALMEADRTRRVAVLPCKVGDRLYEVTGRKTISVYKVRAIRVELFGLFIEWDIVEGFVWQSLSGISAGEIGKTVFLTREEAKEVLEAMREEGAT